MSTPRAATPAGSALALWHLARKDLLRVRRNPIPFLVHLAVPLLITGLIGLAFGGGQGKTGLGRIHLAIVDEDQSLLTRLLRGALNQSEGSSPVQAEFLGREEAWQRVGEGRLSAAVLIPKGFAADYLSARRTVTLELLKNPAQTIHPAVVEEALGGLATALNAVSRVLGPDLAAWRDLTSREGWPAPGEVAALVDQTGHRLNTLRQSLETSRVWYEREQPAANDGEGSPAAGIFGYLLPGMAAMFLLFMADNALRDIYREERLRTLRRYRTLPTSLLAFVVAKALHAFVIMLIGGAILLGGGTALFGIHWSQPGALVCLAVAYALFGAGFMALVTALAGSERRADTLNTIVAMSLGLAGGCMFPRDQLPGIFRNHLTPLMPTDWFASAARSLQAGAPGGSWTWAAAGLAILGCLCVGLATWRLHHRFHQRAAA